MHNIDCNRSYLTVILLCLFVSILQELGFNRVPMKNNPQFLGSRIERLNGLSGSGIYRGTWGKVPVK